MNNQKNTTVLHSFYIVWITQSLSQQGRVCACRNTLQFFTIPIGLLFGGFMIDEVCDPLMRSVWAENSILKILFGNGKGSGAAGVFCSAAGSANILIQIENESSGLRKHCQNHSEQRIQRLPALMSGSRFLLKKGFPCFSAELFPQESPLCI